MTLRQKIILLAIAPLVLALCAIALAIRHQARLLAQQQRYMVESAYMANKKAELQHYVALATQSISYLYDSGRNDPATLREAMNVLAKLDYGKDGYFFLFDLHGNSLMHPRQPHLVGRNLWELRDPNGVPTIQLLTAQAKAGGGFQHYLWEKPSTGKLAPKLGYVVMLERWSWMLGTGLYLDDADTAITEIDTQISGNIHSTMLWIAGIAGASILAIALSGLALNISENRVADAKLKVLAQRVVRSQEEERARLSRDLHDGISQSLVSIKLLIESGVAQLKSCDAHHDIACAVFNRATSQLNGVLGEVRRISHDLRPALLDDLGLATALDHLAREFTETTLISTRFETSGTTEGLSDVENTVLFRIAQESLANIARHAGATNASIRLIGDRTRVRLFISDNGTGFDVERIAQHPKRGIGLRNMHERLEAVGGELKLTSSTNGTEVVATLSRG